MKLLFLLFILPLISGDRIVKTTKGPVRGTSLAPKEVEAFLGIPYAEPPVGPLRFAKPVPKSPWEETYNANELPAACIQILSNNGHFSPDPNKKMSEDCLYLNLWVPEGGKDLKFIMLFIHGGGLSSGSSNMKVYDGATLSEHGDVIVATINYRLGSLGFFSGFNEEAPGSMGMYDQVMAIQWIKDNAKHFGGDPDNILLFGESAGSATVSMHLISPLSRNLFKRAILQSGTAVNLLSFSKGYGYPNASQSIINLSGCADDKDSHHKNPRSVIDCMKALPAEKFSEVDANFMKNAGEFLPIIGDEFLPENTVDAFNKGDFKNTELLIGVTRDEGSLFLTLVLRDLLGLLGEKEGSRNFNETHAVQVLNLIKEINDEEIRGKIRKSYFDRVKMESEYTYLKASVDILGDFIITCGAVFQADYYSLRDNPVYFYIFEYRPASTPFAEWMGVVHSEELAYVFGNPVYGEFTEDETALSRDIMDMWVAFAKTGNPTIPAGIKWPRYTYQDPKYLAIGQHDTVGVRPDNYRCEVWRELFKTVIDEDALQELNKPT